MHKMKKRYWIFLFLAAFVLGGCTKEKKVFARVVDPSTGKGIPNVTVNYNGYESGKVKSNVNGNFTIILKNTKKMSHVQLYMDESENESLKSKYYFPKQQFQNLDLGGDLENGEFLGYEYVDGNVIFHDTASGGPFSYDYIEYVVYSHITAADDFLKIAQKMPFINHQLVSSQLIRGTMFIDGKLHYTNGVVKSFRDSTIVPKSVISSYSWNVNF